MPVVADERGTTVQLQHTCMALTTADVTDVLETAPCSPVLFDQLSSPHLHRLDPVGGGYLTHPAGRHAERPMDNLCGHSLPIFTTWIPGDETLVP